MHAAMFNQIHLRLSTLSNNFTIHALVFPMGRAVEFRSYFLLILRINVIVMTTNQELLLVDASSGWSSRIVDGKNVTPINRYPMILRIVDRDTGPLCGATILNKRWGLTAAHCLRVAGPKAPPSTADRLYVLAGLYYDAKPDPVYTQNVSITNISIHEDFTKKSGNDIAVFRVSPPFSFNERVTPVNLAPCHWTVLRDKEENATAVGWGLGRNRTKPYPPDFPLQEVDIPLRTTGACQRAWVNRTITDNHVCAGGVDGSGACHGDSGGPLFIYDKELDMHYQVGITSFGDGECGNVDKRPPAVWTKVPKYIGWIEEVIRECEKRRYFPIGPLE